MKKVFFGSGFWIGICFCFLLGDSFLLPTKSVVVENEKKMALNVEEAIPDSNFRACLTELVQKGSEQVYDDLTETSWIRNFTKDGKKYDALTEDSLKEIVEVTCNDRNITSINGVEYLTNLWSIDLSGNKLSDVSFSSTTNPNLHDVYLSGVGLNSLTVDDTLANQITNLHVGSNSLGNDVINSYISRFKNLTYFYISANNFTGVLDVSGLSNLIGLWAESSKITEIKGITNKFQYLIIGGNEISSIDVSVASNLTHLQINDNQISSINLSNNSKLTQLWLHNNKLTSVDLSKNTLLDDLNLSGNKIDKVVITSDNLKNLYLSNTEFSSLTINDNNPGEMENLDLANSKISQSELQNIINKFYNLKKLTVSYNDLTSLDVSVFSNLEILNAQNNKISSIDVSKNSNLAYLNLWGNSLKNITLSFNSKLNYLDLYNNELESITLPNSCGDLTYLMLSVNSLTEVDLSKCSALKTLCISSNQLKEIDLSKNTELVELNVAFNNFDSLDLSNNKKIEYFSIDDDMLFKTNYSHLTNLKQISSGKSYGIPVYGNSFSVSSILDYVADYIKYDSYEIYDTTDGDNNLNVVSASSTITRNAGTRLGLRLDLENPTNSNLSTFSGAYNYTNYYSVYFMKLTSDKYVIDEANSKIDVGGDSDEVIKNNLKIDWWANIEVSDNTLKILFDGKTIRQFTLLRTTNPKTGDILIGIIIFLAIFGATASVFIYREKLISKI